MSLERFRFGDAVGNLKNNPASRWWAPDVPGQAPFPNTVPRRLKRGFLPRLTPKFRLASTDRLFTMGSCFARNIEQTLVDLGYDVPSYAEAFATRWASRVAFEGTPRDQIAFRMGFANKYNTPAMLNEFAWAEGGLAARDCPTVMTMADGRVVDLNAHNILAGDDRASVLDRRDLLTRTTRMAFEADVIFLTLGLTEAWFDAATGLYLNDQVSVLKPAVSEQERFELHVLSFADNLAALQGIYDILLRRGRPGWRLIVTVSPVPLLATLTGRDVVVANTYSKSVLHAAATEFSMAHANVDYFPSFEMVMNAKAEDAWKEDLRHVRDETVARVMRAFLTAYLDGAPLQRPGNRTPSASTT